MKERRDSMQQNLDEVVTEKRRKTLKHMASYDRLTVKKKKVEDMDEDERLISERDATPDDESFLLKSGFSDNIDDHIM